MLIHAQRKSHNLVVLVHMQRSRHQRRTSRRLQRGQKLDNIHPSAVHRSGDGRAAPRAAVADEILQDQGVAKASCSVHRDLRACEWS
jgi:hypothetical protein